MSLKPDMYICVLTTYFTFVCICVFECAHISDSGFECTYMHVEIRGQPWMSFLRSYPPCFVCFFFLYLLVCFETSVTV